MRMRSLTRKSLAFLEHLSSVGPNEPVCQVAREHRGRLPMAVASGGVRQVVIDQLHAIHMHSAFDAIVGAEDTELHNPNPDVFLEAARRLNVPAQECVVFEDTDIGIQAARSAGMDYVDVRQLQLGVQSEDAQAATSHKPFKLLGSMGLAAARHNDCHCHTYCLTPFP